MPAGRITERDLDDLTESVQYHHFPGTTVTVCCLNTTAGFATVGHSACYNRAEYDRRIGEQIAREAARTELRLLASFHAKASDAAANDPD